jgi:predicted SAM-dependent methyltransferase
MKLNLGCGFDHRAGYLNVDMHPFTNPDLVADVLDLSMLPAATYDEIIAQDVLEHFRWCDTPRALLEWNRLLRQGGSLFIRTTYIVGLAKRFRYPEYQDIPTQKLLVVNLFSQQLMEGDCHLTAVSERLIRYYLWETGFEVKTIGVRDEWLFDIHARKTVEYYNEELVSSNSDDTNFVREVYRQMLGREPDQMALIGGQSNYPRGILIGGLSSSAYFLVQNAKQEWPRLVLISS